MNMLKTLSVAVLSIGISFGQFVLTGQMSTSVNYDSTVAFSTPYTGVILAGDGWELSAQLTDGDFIIEEAKYTWGMDDNTSFYFLSFFIISIASRSDKFHQILSNFRSLIKKIKTY